MTRWRSAGRPTTTAESPSGSRCGSRTSACGGASLGTVVLDTETTGLSPANDEILQLGIIDETGQVLVDRTYRPQRHDAWPEAERIHGISPADVADSPALADDLAEVQSILDRAERVVGWNVEFDLAFLGHAGLRLEEGRALDAMEAYGMATRGSRWVKLVDAAAEVGHSYRPHGAVADCEATLACLRNVRKPRTPVRASSGPASPEPRRKAGARAIRAGRRRVRPRLVVAAAFASACAASSLSQVSRHGGVGLVTSAVLVVASVVLWRRALGLAGRR